MEIARNPSIPKDGGPAATEAVAPEITAAPEPKGSESGRAQPKIEVKIKRRSFSTAYKVQIVEQAEACQESGEVGALLRREGLYSSHLSNWRAQYRAGGKAALKTTPRGPKTKRNALQDELHAITRQRDKLTRQLEQAQLIIEIQKKLPAF